MKRIAALVALALAGAATAALLAAQAASAWDYNNLPPNCHTEGAPYDSSVMEYVAFFRCDGVGAHFNYGTQAPPAAPTDPSFQSNLDAFVNAHYTAPATTVAPTTTTTDTTTTAAATTTAGVTTTAPAVTTAPATTQAPAAPAPSSPAPAPATPTCDVQCQIDAINARIDALRSELTSLEHILESWPNIDPGILAQLMSLSG